MFGPRTLVALSHPPLNEVHCTDLYLQDQQATSDLIGEVLGTLGAVCDAVPATAVEDEEPAGRRIEASLGPSWNTLLIGCDIFGALHSCLTGKLEDDALLEAVVLAGALAGHAALAQQLADSGVVSGGKYAC